MPARSSSFLLLALALSSFPALAQSRFMELQLTAPDLADFFRIEAMRQAADYCGSDTGIPSAACQGNDCLLDHVEILPGGSFRQPGTQRDVEVGNLGSFTTPTLEYLQPVEAYFKRKSCAEDPGCAITSYASSQTLHVILELSLSDSSLCVEPVGILEAPSFEVPLGNGRTCTQLNLRAATRVVGDSMRRRGVGLAADLDGATDVVAVRVEYLDADFDELPASVRSDLNAERRRNWRSFFGGGLASASAPSGSEWRIHLSKGLLEASTKERFRHVVAVAPELALDGPIQATWLPTGVMNVALTVEVDVDVCPHTIETDISGSFQMSLDSGDVRLVGDVLWNPDDPDVAACGVILGLALPGILTVPIAAVFASEYSPPTDDFEDNRCDANEIGDGIRLNCRLPLGSLNFQHSTTYLSLAVGQGTPASAGFTLSGSADAAGPGQFPPAGITTEATLGYGVHGSCEDATAGYWSAVAINGPRVCGQSVIHDALHVYDVVGTEVTQWMGLRTEVEVEFPGFLSVFCQDPGGSWSYCESGEAPIEDFWRQPYPLHLLVRSNSGWFTLAASAPTEPSSAEAQAALDTARLARVACTTEETGWFGIPGLWNPNWEVDPPYDAVLWERTREGVRDVGRVRVESVRMQPAESMVNGLGVVRARAMPLVAELTLRLGAGRRTHRTVVRVPISVDWNLGVSAGRISSMSSRNAISSRVSVGAVLPNTSFQLEMPAGSIRLR